MYQPLIWVSVLFLVGVSGEGCPRFPTVVAMNLQLQMGNWGIHGFFGGPDYRDPTLQCYHIELSANQFSQEPVLIEASASGTNVTTGTAVSEQFSLEVPLLAVSGRWQTNIGDVDYVVSVLHTDYVEYSLMVRCGEVNGQPEFLYMLLSRGHNQMPDAIVQRYRDFVENDLGQTVAKYYKVTHDHSLCH